MDENEDPFDAIELTGALIKSTVTTGNDFTFNACVGGNTGSNENSIGYAGGFEKAAEVLLATLGVAKPVAGSNSWGREPLVDMLVYPICYCARHHVELTLKRMIPKAWAAYQHRFSANQKGLTAPKPKDIRHNIKAVWTDLSKICAATDDRLANACVEMEPYIDDLHFIDGTGQVFRYDEDFKTKKLHLKGINHIDLTYFASGYAELCKILEKLEYALIDVHCELATDSFTTKLTRDQLIQVAERLAAGIAEGDGGFAKEKQRIIEKFELTGKDFQRAEDKIYSTRSLSIRVGIELPISHLDEGVLGRLLQAGNGDRNAAESLTEDERSALYAVLEVGSPYVHAEMFESYLIPKPSDADAAAQFESARDASYLARRYRRDPELIAAALADLGQPTLLEAFKKVYEDDLGRQQREREAYQPIDFNAYFAARRANGQGDAA